MSSSEKKTETLEEKLAKPEAVAEIKELENNLKILPIYPKYLGKVKELIPYLTPWAEWMECAKIQYILLETRCEFGQADKNNVSELSEALNKISPAVMCYIEDNMTHHDQLAVLEEIGRYVSKKTKALLHPGTTSYDILDTARSVLFKKAWSEIIRPEAVKTITALCNLAKTYEDRLIAGRTHLQLTSPILLGSFFASYAGRLAERLTECDNYLNNLKGKMSGIVGTGAGIEMVIGQGQGLEFEKIVLKKLELLPDNTAFQIVQKEGLSDVGHGLGTLSLILCNLGDDLRLLYSSGIKELYSAAKAKTLGMSSTDAAKENPVDPEHLAGKAGELFGDAVMGSWLIMTNLQRDLRNSGPLREFPQRLMTQLYESLKRTNKELKDVRVNVESIESNLKEVERLPSEAMTTILRGEPGWIHSIYGLGHDFVKAMSLRAKNNKTKLIDEALQDKEFAALYETLIDEKKSILNGQLKLYTGFAKEKIKSNIEYANSVINKKL
ncbi:Fumarate hydratase class II [Candidatus Tiddalikarchaeum anstoanum]|nr:Fumarate hydratase class II [Candidatus Tiddalikarchaeum anstoanum]